MFFSLSCLFNVCVGQKKTNRPHNLEEALINLESLVDSTSRVEFMSLSEDDFIGSQHFILGRWIRNEWLSKRKNNHLIEYFDSLGISALEDMSGIILSSFHRNINNEPIDLASQLIELDSVRKMELSREELANSRLKAELEAIKIGDIIEISFLVDKQKVKKPGVYHHPIGDIPSDLEELIIVGAVERKEIQILENYINNYIIEVKIQDLGGYECLWIGLDGKSKVGDTFTYNIINEHYQIR